VNMRSRRYTDDDLPRLQAALASWIREAGDCGYCHVSEIAQRIYTPVRDLPPAADRVQIWEDDTGIGGFALNLRIDNAFEVYTSPLHRTAETERLMLESAAAATMRLIRQVGRRANTLIIDVWDCDTARSQALEALGFEYYRVWGYLAQRTLLEPVELPQLPDGFSIRHAASEDSARLAAVRNGAFDRDLKPADYLDLVMLQPGYDPQSELVVVAPDGSFAAFAQIGLDSLNKVGLFEPVGTHRDFRRRGLGRALMLYALQEMKRHGMETAMIGYDATNIPAARLYQSLGFQNKYTTWGYKRGY
jgi:mycothiol synthase